MFDRPSYRELKLKIELAKKHCDRIAENAVLIIDHKKFSISLDEPGLTVEEVLHSGFLKGILNEIDPDNYTGSSPPHVSYEISTNGLELWAFSFTCKFLDSVIGKSGFAKYYFKFCVTDKVLWLVTLHYDRPGK